MTTTTGEAFIRFAIAQRVLEFGDFTLKSGRVSPYFFNLGAICEGAALSRLGRFYADAIAASGLGFDVIFGPAYKGIPLANVAAVCLHQRHGVDKAVAYNRKEVKDHGERGRLVGAALAGKRVLILDDVITAGTAVREAAALIQDAGGTVAGVAVCFDRGEKGPNGDSAINEIERELQLKVICLSGFSDLLSCVDAEEHDRLEAYSRRCGET